MLMAVAANIGLRSGAACKVQQSYRNRDAQYIVAESLEQVLFDDADRLCDQIDRHIHQTTPH
jgi:hypothetical protein